RASRASSSCPRDWSCGAAAAARPDGRARWRPAERFVNISRRTAAGSGCRCCGVGGSAEGRGMRLLLIRHRQTPSNGGGPLPPAAPGPGLTSRGHRQAEAVPAALAEEEISGIYVSGLLRTHLTAAPLADALGMTPSRHGGLDEISAGDMEGRTDPGAV